MSLATAGLGARAWQRMQLCVRWWAWVHCVALPAAEQISVPGPLPDKCRVPAPMPHRG